MASSVQNSSNPIELIHLIEGGDLARANELLESESGGKNYYLHEAADQGALKAMSFFLQKKWGGINDTDYMGCTPLHYGAKSDVTARKLIELGARISPTDSDGLTPLYRAVLYRVYELRCISPPPKNETAIDTLLDLTDSFKEKEGSSISLLHWAIMAKHRRLVSRLVNENFNIARKDKIHGSTPIHIAAESFPEGLDLLLRSRHEFISPCHHSLKNHPMNTKDNQGDTPLHRAARCEMGESIAILLEAGADHSLVNNRGQTAEAIAREVEAENIIALFRE